MLAPWCSAVASLFSTSAFLPPLIIVIKDMPCVPSLQRVQCRCTRPRSFREAARWAWFEWDCMLANPIHLFILTYIFTGLPSVYPLTLIFNPGIGDAAS